MHANDSDRTHGDNPDLTIALWIFPERDFAAWLALTGQREIASYAEYVAMLAAIESDQASAGRKVARVHLTVSAMRDLLAAGGLDNTPDNRARIMALEYAAEVREETGRREP